MCTAPLVSNAQLSWTLVINGTGEVEYNLWNRAISVQYPNGTVANNMYHRHPLKRINLKFTGVCV